MSLHGRWELGQHDVRIVACTQSRHVAQDRAWDMLLHEECWQCCSPGGIKALLSKQPGGRYLIVARPELVRTSTQGLRILLQLGDAAVHFGEVVIVLGGHNQKGQLVSATGRLHAQTRAGRLSCLLPI